MAVLNRILACFPRQTVPFSEFSSCEQEKYENAKRALRDLIVQPVERSLEVARVAGVGKGVEFGIYHQVARCVESCVLGKAMIEGKVAR